MPEHSEAEISLSAYVTMTHSHERVAFCKYTLTLLLVRRGRTKTLRSSSLSYEQRSQSHTPSSLHGSRGSEGTQLPSFFSSVPFP